MRKGEGCLAPELLPERSRAQSSQENMRQPLKWDYNRLCSTCWGRRLKPVGMGQHPIREADEGVAQQHILGVGAAFVAW